MASLFKQPDGVVGITFMLRGEAGSGKTRFALGVKRTAGRVAYIGTDRGAKFYHADPEVGGFLQVESRDVKVVRAAIQELTESSAVGFGAVVIDTVTDLWEGEQSEYVKPSPKGPFIPLRSWKPMRDGHEKILRSLQALPVHTFLICEEKPIYQRVGGGEDDAAELREVGTKEDADKKDSYVADVRLRFFVDSKKKKFLCEVLKDRTGTFPMGDIVENARPEMWIKGPASIPAVPDKKDEEEARLGAELLASNMIASIRKIHTEADKKKWKKDNSKDFVSLPKDLQDKVLEAGKKTAEQIEKEEALHESAPQ